MHAPRPSRPDPGFIILLGLMTAFGALAIDMYLPALPSMAAALGTSSAATQQTIASFLLGMAAGQLVHGPLSDRVGRREPVLAGLILFIVASIACALADSIDALIAARFVQGFGGCAAMVIARAMVRDRFDHVGTARVFSWLTLIFGVSPVLAPLGGVLLLDAYGWRAIFWAIAAFGTAITIGALLRLPETRTEEAKARARAQPVLGIYPRLIGKRRLVGYTLAAATAQAAIFAYISASSTIFIADFGLTPAQYTLSFAANAIAMITGAQLNRRALRRLTPDAVAARAILVSLAIAAGFALLAALGQATLVVTLVATFFLMGAHGFTQGNLSASALSIEPDHAGAIAALMGVTNFLLGAASSAIVAAAHDGTPLPVAAALLLGYALSVPAYYLLARPR